MHVLYIHHGCAKARTLEKKYIITACLVVEAQLAYNIFLK